MELFPKDEKVGVFRGYRDGGLEFHADLAIPYRPRLHNIPMHGQFLLVQLENEDEAVLGRITAVRAEGQLAAESGERYTIRAMNEERRVPDHLREDFLRYRIDIRVLGVLRADGDDVTFAPSHRRLPHVGSPVAFPSEELLIRIVNFCKANTEGADLGFFALGEFIYSAGDDRLDPEPWVQIKTPKGIIQFDVKHLVSRRSFIFARAGYGKSNLNKLLFSTLYKSKPTIRRGNADVPVGTVIFDPDGEYFWPDNDGNPGLCDVADLKDQLVVFTDRDTTSDYYRSFVVGGVKLDIRRFSPGDVIAISLSPEKQDQQNVRKLKGLNQGDWTRLVDLIYRNGNSADIDQIAEILRLDSDRQQYEALAARSNMTTIVRQLHDPSSQVVDVLLKSLGDGKLCIVDVSRMRGDASLKLSGLLLRRIFDHNLEEFTKRDSKSIPVIAVIEEAQSVLSGSSAASEPYVEWVKEGRKYGLCSVMITQQPGSIPNEILSQGDNWFIFHLLSEKDLNQVHHANAHFSRDILSSLLNEPIPGQGIFWSGVSGAPYPISLRVLSFRRQNMVQDPQGTKGAVSTYASNLRKQINVALAELVDSLSSDQKRDVSDVTHVGNGESGAGMPQDVLRVATVTAIAKLRVHPDFKKSIEKNGIPYGVVIGQLEQFLPSTIHNRNQVAYSLVPEAMDTILGKDEWDTEIRDTSGGKHIRFIFKK